jgi:hypothetical protein
MEKTHINQPVLQVLGKEHQGTIHIDVFLLRMLNEARERGHRARRAARAHGKDWKALSHALRVIDEVTELLTDGTVTFPLKNAEYICRVKHGDIDFDEVSERISEGIIHVDALRETTLIQGSYDQSYARECIQYIYAHV